MKRNWLLCIFIVCYINTYRQHSRWYTNLHSISIIILVLQLNKLCHWIIIYGDPLKIKWTLISTFSSTCHVSVTKQCLILNSGSESLLWQLLSLFKVCTKLQTAYYHPLTNSTFYEEPLLTLTYPHPV